MEVAKRYGIGKTQVYKLCKQKDVLESDKGVSVPNYSKITSMKSITAKNRLMHVTRNQ